MDTNIIAKENLEKHLERCEQKVVERRNAILQKLQSVAKKLLERFPSIQRIVIIGSVAEPIFFTMHSDVDIVIAGLENYRYFEAFRLIEESLDMEDIDLIREEEASELLMKKIEKGIVLYDKQKQRNTPNP
jgi:predicted nucleotidyltransferase